MVRSIYTKLMLIKNKICSLSLQEVSMAGQSGHMSSKMHFVQLSIFAQTNMI